jgi:L-seryl-tRNA(Ser) seleniumtransferase
MTLPTQLVQIRHPELTASALEARLRRNDPPVIVRIEHDIVILDLRTVDASDDDALVRSLEDATR